jgi:purine-binding chemotaxis protein CheW
MAGALEQQHLVGFSVGGEEFGIDILRVQEIIRMMDITHIPRAPEFVEGVINLRGRVIPVVDFRRRFRLDQESTVSTESRRIVVIEVAGVTIGFIVDGVSEVRKLTQDQIAPAPPVVRGKGGEAIAGVGMVSDRMIILLDIDRFFSTDELGEVAQAA